MTKSAAQPGKTTCIGTGAKTWLGMTNVSPGGAHLMALRMPTKAFQR